MSRSFTNALSRRRLLQGACGRGLLASPAAAALWAAVPERGIHFDLLRGEALIGSHRVDFRADGDRLAVETRIEVRVAPLGIVLFAYRHHGRERYAGERLVAFDSETDDDGGRFFVHGHATADGFAVRTKKGEALLPGVKWSETAYAAANGADLVVILTEWNEFRALDLEKLCRKMNIPRMADLRNIYDAEMAKAAGFEAYMGVGR